MVGAVAFLAATTEKRIEVNAMTGAIRTKIKYAFVFDTPWKTRTTWLAESAARQGISTGSAWQYLSTVSESPLHKSFADKSAPASYPLIAISPELLNLATEDDIDRFVREFVSGDEARRSQLIFIP